MRTSVQQHPPLKQHPKGVCIAGYASLFNIIDQQHDRIAKGAFTKTLRAWRLSGKMPKMLWQHDPKQPIGVWTRLVEDLQGLYVEGQLILGVPKAYEAALLIKEKALDGLSIGFRVIESVHSKYHKARILLDIDLIEISLVTFGANAKATISVMKDLQE